jgi:hypothetical protein
MKSSAAMRTRKTTLILLISLAALTMWIPQQSRLAQVRLAVEEAEAQRVKLVERIATATAALDTARQELRAQQADRAETLAAAAKAEQELARVDPESRWVAPPATLPDWSAESPYVWLRKEILPMLPVQVFTERGELRGDFATVLAANEGQQRALNTELPRLLAQYRSLEVANVERTDEHLSGIEGDGPKMTIRIKPMPEEGARLKQQLETVLRNELGPQRADLVMKLSEGWLNEQLNHFGAGSTTLSAMRHPNGTYSISVKSGGNWWTHGGVSRMEDHIPPHLLPLFNDVVSQAEPAAPATGSIQEK